MIKTKISKKIAEAAEKLGISTLSVRVDDVENLEFGDFFSNVAMVHAKEIKENPKELANKIKDSALDLLGDMINKVEVAGPGFINIFLSRKAINESLNNPIPDLFAVDEVNKKKVMIEYTDPNPFKEFHIGHLMSNTIGESISRLIESSGSEVKRACYQGDVGLHVAKAIWGMKSIPARENSPLKNMDLSMKVKYLGNAYKLGSSAYESGHKDEIDDINEKIYAKSDSEINALYEEGRKLSLEYFETIYKKLGTKFDYYFFESQMADEGLRIVKKFLGKVFEESDGACVFRGEKYNPHLHTRVYITKKGLPTYEAKELALHEAKVKKYESDRSIVVTANEQDGVFSVGLEAYRQINKEQAEKITHISHGMMITTEGKMSSRKGNVITAERILQDTEHLVREKIKDKNYKDSLREEIVDSVSVGAVKFSILKQNIGGDIVVDLNKAVSFEGDSGPYLQYTCARAKSIVRKAHDEGIKPITLENAPINKVERIIVRFPDVVCRATNELSPNILAEYLLELASSFNSFYAEEQIVDKNNEFTSHKVKISFVVSGILQKGLDLLGIKVPERM